MAVPRSDLRVENLSSGYGATLAIEDVSFALASGGRLAILGRNGVGKTTLLSTLMGLTRQRGGCILFAGHDLSHKTTAERADLGLGLVPQTRDIFASLNVEENLVAGLKSRPRSSIDEAYQLFPRLAERRRNPAGALSGGEQQMLSVARTLLGEPRLVLLDEPLEGLAPILCDEVMVSLTHLVDEKRVGVILVEQQVERALDFVDEVMFLDRGRIVFAGRSAEVKQRPDIVERYVGVALRAKDDALAVGKPHA